MLCPPGVTEFLWVSNMKGFNVSLSDVQQLKEPFMLTADYYPGRFGKCIIINLHWMYNVIWNVVKLFISKQAAEKYVFISGNDNEVFEELKKHIAPQYIPQDCYGKTKYCSWKYDYQQAAQEEMALRQKFNSN